jgi:hypothetical protein
MAQFQPRRSYPVRTAPKVLAGVGNPTPERFPKRAPRHGLRGWHRPVAGIITNENVSIAQTVHHAERVAILSSGKAPSVFVKDESVRLQILHGSHLAETIRDASSRPALGWPEPHACNLCIF